MKSFISVILLVLGLSTLYTQDKKVSIAVLDFQTTGGLTPQEVATLANRFRGILVQTQHFDVVEREKMNDVLKAQDFNLSDQCNSAECAVQVGQLLGVTQMIAGDLGKLGLTYTIDLRLIDVETGKILQSKTQDYKGEIDGMLEVMKVIANSFAGKTLTESKEKGKKKKEEKVATEEKASTGGSGGKSKTLWYVIGGVAVLGGGGAAVLLGGGGGGKKSPSGIPDPIFPN
jgi:TolB-like protein